MNASLSSTPSNVTLPVSRAQTGPSSYVVWLGLMAWLVVVKLVISTFFPQAFADPAQAAFFGWLPLAIFGGLGLAGIWLADRTGFPAAFDLRVSSRQRFLYPVLLGLLFSAAHIGFDLATGYSKFQAAQHGLTFRIALLQTLAEMNADFRANTRILTNILGNSGLRYIRTQVL